MVADSQPAPDQIALSVTLSANPELVWHALTAGRDHWWASMRFEARVGAPLVESWLHVDGTERHTRGVVTLAEPGRRLGFSWTDPGCEQRLEVEFVLAPAPHGTQLFLNETGFAALSRGAELHREHTQGWMEHLGNLDRAAAGLTLDD